MCGICGVVALGAGAVDPGPVRDMLAALTHRGPDGEGMFHEPTIAAGNRRLAVIDPEGGGQPLDNETGDVRVVFNGEIYNFRELREGLRARGHRFRTASDTEVLVHLWEEDGPDLVHRLRGMFAFCLHDRTTGETLLARDRMGIKPLYLHHRQDRVIFASEPAALLRHPDVERSVNGTALTTLFCLQYLPGDETAFEGLAKLLPGHLLHVRRGEVVVRRWWTPRDPPVESPPADERDRAEVLRRMVDDAVRERLVADVPVGAFLSGGIDSSIVVGSIARQTGAPVRTFTVGFEGGGVLDETGHAREVSRHFGTEHHELTVTASEVARRLPAVVGHLGEPVLDPAMLPTVMLSAYARQRVVVALTGEGADELFAGYRRYAFRKRYGWIGRIPGVAAAARTGLPRLLPGRTGQALEAIAAPSPEMAHVRWCSILGRAEAERLFEPAAFRAHEQRAAAHFARHFEQDEPRLHQELLADQQEWLPHNLLSKVDRATMAHSLEARVPFLDHRIVSWANALPEADRLRPGVSKPLLRLAFRDRLPPGVTERPKRGFDLPLDDWIRGPLREIAGDLLTAPRLARWDGLRPSHALHLLEEHLAGRRDFGLPLFNIVSMMLFLDEAGRS